MKTKALLFLATASLLHAGSPDLETPLVAKPEPWIKPVIDIRARYEFADIDGFNQSNAFTTRERLGLKTQSWNGFSALIEGEFSQAVVDDYNGGAVGADPYNPSDSLIADPETNELNQGYLQYTGYDTTAKAGRQRIIYDNAALIGNAGWRQNEQTFDSISLANTSIDKLTLNYAYISQVNRIFGSEASAKNFEYVDANVNLFNASYTGINGVTLGAYAYLMNFDELSAWDNNTFGLSAKATLAGIALYGEFAYQDQAGVFADDSAYYTHVTATKTFGKQTIILGLENLGQGFKTPLATVHAFNGLADGTDGGRISGAQNGLTDLYLGYTVPIFCGIQWSNVVHALGDNTISTGYGWEFDSVLTKKFDDNFTAIATFAFFESEGDAYTGGSAGPAVPTTQRITVELNYTF
jgi:hypothetical protein